MHKILFLHAFEDEERVLNLGYKCMTMTLSWLKAEWSGFGRHVTCNVAAVHYDIPTAA